MNGASSSFAAEDVPAMSSTGSNACVVRLSESGVTGCFLFTSFRHVCVEVRLALDGIFPSADSENRNNVM